MFAGCFRYSKPFSILVVAELQKKENNSHVAVQRCTGPSSKGVPLSSEVIRLGGTANDLPTGTRKHENRSELRSSTGAKGVTGKWRTLIPKLGLDWQP